MMGISILAIRKKLLRGIQELRRLHLVNTRPKAPPVHSKVSMIQPPAIPNPETSSVVHEENLLTGEYDEDASRASFAEALNQWRKLHQSGSIEEEVITLTNVRIDPKLSIRSSISYRVTLKHQ